ncbi:hypothetical protein COE23_05660 [Bacillus cereus]|nr:hypothetical protein COE23_05660 [Bacillus cereus]
MFRKTPTLRSCKILYIFLTNPVTNENLKTHTTIGIYKKMHRVIKREKGGFHMIVGIRFVLATDNETLC